jgi:hypothetical protein
MPEDNEGGFKVTDRRLFNPDGSLREQLPEEAPAPAPATAATAAPIPAPPPPEPEPSVDFDSEMGDDQGEMTEFMGVIMEFAAPAFIHLGLAEHPATGRPQVNLPAAQQAIEMLRILREKTTGNLTPEEENFFDGLLTDLRMQFVSLNR